MDDNVSESLLTEILSLVQQLNANVNEFKEELDKVKTSIKSLENKIEEIVHSAFLEGDLKKHRSWHEKTKEKSFFSFFK